MKFALYLVFLCSCTVSKNRLSGQLTVQYFKDRALCNCLVTSLDSAATSPQVQKLKENDPVAAVLFDSAINAHLTIVMSRINQDSTNRIGRVAENAQGKKPFRQCMEFYRSKELDTLARTVIKKWRHATNLEEYISSRYPTW